MANSLIARKRIRKGKDFLQARVAALGDRNAQLKKLVVGGLLDLDQVGHFRHFGNGC